MGRILIADDHETLRRTLAQSLAENGHEVDEAPNGNAAIEKLHVVVDDPDADTRYNAAIARGLCGYCHGPQRPVRCFYRSRDLNGSACFISG